MRSFVPNIVPFSLHHTRFSKFSLYPDLCSAEKGRECLMNAFDLAATESSSKLPSRPFSLTGTCINKRKSSQHVQFKEKKGQYNLKAQRNRAQCEGPKLKCLLNSETSVKMANQPDHGEQTF